MNRLRRWLAGLRICDAAVPFILLAIAILCYGLLIPGLGFFWDDFPLSWIYDTYGVDGLERYFSTNRPYWGLLFRLTMPLLGGSPWAWQLFGLFWRWLSAVLLWLLLRRIWKQVPQVALWASLLFLVYPGFQQQHIPIIYGHLFLVFCCYLLSLYLNIWAMTTHSRWRWAGHALALASGLYQMLAMEYFFLLELLRPLVIWLLLGGDSLPARKRLKRTVLGWLPYVAIFGAAFIWRVFFFSFQTENYRMVFLDQLKEAPIPALGHLLGNIAQSFWVVLGQAWGSAFRIPDLNSLGLKSTALTVGVILTALVFVLAILIVWRRGREEVQPRKSAWAMGAIGLGLLAFLLGGGPSWSIDVLPQLIFALDRFTLPFLLGASLLLAGFIGWLPLRNWMRLVLVGVLVSLAIGQHFQVSVAYRRDWETQQRFFWQLAWRIPELEPGTILLVNQLPVHYYTDNSLTAPLNWYWAADNHSQDMSYLLYYPQQRLGSNLAALEPGIPVVVDYLAAQFEGNTSQIVAITYQPPACLRVLDPGVDFDNKMLPEEMQAAALLSSTQWIGTQRTTAIERLPARLYGEEPPYGWCYYFSQAELARQQGDWSQVAALGDQAFALGDYPNDPAERLVFIEGYAHTGAWDRAEQLSGEVQSITPMMQPVLCHLWTRIANETSISPEREVVLEQIFNNLTCTE
ncbi:MAG TPA: hypothetical protein VLM83_07705 [Anaerolineales bacterium]|nr:hypothetical protein [Anaerolineales bacterium]